MLSSVPCGGRLLEVRPPTDDAVQKVSGTRGLDGAFPDSAPTESLDGGQLCGGRVAWVKSPITQMLETTP